MRDTETAHKAYAAAGPGGAVAGAAAVLIGHYAGMDLELQAALAVVLGYFVPFIWTYYQRNYPK